MSIMALARNRALGSRSPSDLVTTLEKQNTALHANDSQLFQKTQLELDELRYEYRLEVDRLREELEYERRVVPPFSVAGVPAEIHEEVDRLRADLSSMQGGLGERVAVVEQGKADTMHEHILNVRRFREEILSSLREMQDLKTSIVQTGLQRVEEVLEDGGSGELRSKVGQ